MSVALGLTLVIGDPYRESLDQNLCKVDRALHDETPGRRDESRSQASQFHAGSEERCRGCPRRRSRDEAAADFARSWRVDDSSRIRTRTPGSTQWCTTSGSARYQDRRNSRPWQRWLPRPVGTDRGRGGLDRGRTGLADEAARTLDRGSESAVFADRNSMFLERTRRTLYGSEPFSEGGDEVATSVALVETVEVFEDRGTAHSVDGNPRVALKVHHGADGVVSVDRVHSAGVETECREATLQLTDVVSSEHPVPSIEEAITESVSGFDQSVPGTTVETSRGIDSVCALESPQSLLRRRSKQAGRIARAEVELASRSWRSRMTRP